LALSPSPSARDSAWRSFRDWSIRGAPSHDNLTVNVNGGDPSTINAFLVGDAPTMSGSAHGGNDVLNGGASDDLLYGDAVNYAPSAPGSITGGKDVLNGGSGNDQLWGGPNNDTFVFKVGSGNDVINDFDQGNRAVGSTAPEHDVINVHDYGFASWAALSSLISDDSSGNAVIHLTADDTVTLNGVHTAALHSTDFIV
jgi:Ca2+-binding RTX toxin-like protein